MRCRELNEQNKTLNLQTTKLTTKMKRLKSVICYSLGVHLQEASAYIRIISPFNKLGVHLIDGLREGLDDLDLIREADVVIIHRFFPGSLQSLHNLIDKCKYYNKKLIFDIDDLLFDLPKHHSDRLNFSFTEALLPIYQVIQAADLVTVSTTYLKDQINELNDNIIVLPNYIDDDLWEFKPVGKDRSQELIIGYMGTKTHIRDLEIIAPALLEILDRFSGRVLFKIYGFEPPEILKQHQFVLFDSKFDLDYTKFVRYFQTCDVDIGIAPLSYNLFNKCKSHIKFLEYSISGIPGVYSNIKPYEEIIIGNNNALLASGIQEWRLALKRLIEDEDLRVKLALEAQATVKESWTLSKNIHEWLSSLESKCFVVKNDKYLSSRSIYFIKSISGQQLELTSHLRRSILALEEQVRHKDHAIAALEEQVRHRDHAVAALEEQVRHRDHAVAALEEQVRHKDHAIAALEEQIKMLNQEIAVKIAKITDLQKEILSYALSFSWKITRPLRILRRKIENLIS